MASPRATSIPPASNSPQPLHSPPSASLPKGHSLLGSPWLAASSPEAADCTDSLVKAEQVKEMVAGLRERTRGIEKAYRRLAESEIAATKSVRKALAKAQRPAEALGSDEQVSGRGRLPWLLPRAQTLWDHGASQGESLAGVWESEHRRWVARGASVQEVYRRMHDDLRLSARDLCAARAQSEKLQRKYGACRSAALQALRTRDAMEEQSRAADFATACAAPSMQEQKVAKRVESAFRDYVLTKQASARHTPVLQRAEEQMWTHIRSLMAVCGEAQDAFCRDLRESLQLTAGSLNVFSLSSMDSCSEFRCDLSKEQEKAKSPSSPQSLSIDVEVNEGASSSDGTPTGSRQVQSWPSLGLQYSNTTQTGEQTTCNAQRMSRSVELSFPPSGQEIAELSVARCARLEDDQAILRRLQILFTGVRESEDHVLRACSLAQFPSPSCGDPDHIHEACSWLSDAMRVRVEASGAMSTLLLERLLPTLEQHVGDAKADWQLVQDEQHRTTSSISHAAQARQQKFNEVPSLGVGPSLACEDSELIFCTRMARILEEVRQRAVQRGEVIADLLNKLLGIGLVKLHVCICETAPNTLRRLAAASTAPLQTNTDFMPAQSSGEVQLTLPLLDLPEASSAGADDALLEAEEKRVKLIAKAVGDFVGHDGFGFSTGDEIKVTLQIEDSWVGMDQQGVRGEFPAHLVEVEGRTVGDSLPELVNLFKKHVLHSDDYTASAEDEEFATRFAEYLGRGSAAVTEQVLASYACALLPRSLLLQGRVYFTTRFVGFFSHFNDSTLLGDTIILFRLSEISQLEKRNNALIFPNSIEVTLNDGKVHFFTSFLQRDNAFEYLSNLRSVWQHVNRDSNDSGEAISSGVVGREVPIQEDEIRVLPASSSAPYPSSCESKGAKISSPLKYELPGRIFGVALDHVFDIIFRSFGKDSFQARVEQERGARLLDAEAQAWSPEPVQGSASECTPNVSRRQAHLQRPVNAAAWMRRLAKVPEWCDCVEHWSLLGLGKGEAFAVQIETEVTGVPYADYFVCKIRYKATSISCCRTQLDCEIDLEWRKSTLLQSRIEQTTTDEFRRMFDAQFLPLATRTLVPDNMPSRSPVAAETSDGNMATPAMNANARSCRDDSKDREAAAMPSSSDRPHGLWQCAHTMWRTMQEAMSGHVLALAFLVIGMIVCCLLLAVLIVLLRLETLMEKLQEAQSAEESSATSCTAD